MIKSKSRHNAEQIIEEHQSRLRKYINERIDNQDDTEDILQDVFYQLLKNMEDSVSPIRDFSSWLYRVAHNLIINKGKKKKEEELPIFQMDDDEDNLVWDLSEIFYENLEKPDTPEMEYLKTLVWSELDVALSELPPEQREVFELTELEGIPIKEISSLTGIPVNTLLSRKHYAILFLRKRFISLYHDIIYTK
ncbi:MAG TPA: RNA polymerase sigma factor [Bacteroidales bacterium]|jgi:RNA polymerase sigma factor (sigma-70 family)|nr:RNA polymerase sigma factor [Bacteroidales bacterium]HPS71200.1 RNA polymerase sigma factor [Bacteroidales bacterium]